LFYGLGCCHAHLHYIQNKKNKKINFFSAHGIGSKSVTIKFSLTNRFVNNRSRLSGSEQEEEEEEEEETNGNVKRNEFQSVDKKR